MVTSSRARLVGLAALVVGVLAVVGGLALDRGESTASVPEGPGGVLGLSWPAVEGARGVRITVGPEPPSVEGGPLPASVGVATLPSDVTRHRIAGLAPGVDVFARIVVDTNDGEQVFLRRARTRGGPRDAPGPLREAHLLAPDLLAVVAVGGSGDRWARGPWTVAREDGSAIEVRRVHRRSLPVAQPRYEVGFRADSEPDVVVDHWVMLRLAEPVGERATLRVTGPEGVEMLLPYSDRYLATPVVQLNQVGYAPDATRRYAYVSFWLGDGGPLSLEGFPRDVEVLSGGEGLEPPHVVATLPLEARAGADPDAGTEVRQIDLSSLPASADRLRIRIPGVGISWPTHVDEQAAFEAYWVTARGLFHNRWGGDLTPRTTDWPRPPDHPTVFTSEQADAFADIPEDTPRTGERALHGGHHDAGDFDIRPSHTAVARRLMRAYELAPGHHTDGQLVLPESGNGIPDLLDEALWSLAAWEQLQEADGGVRGGVQSYRHPWGIYFAHDDPLPYWTFAREPNVTARAAALFAQAARLLEPFDAARSRSLRDRAERAHRWAAAHGAGDAFLLYAESELLHATGEATWARGFERRLERLWPDRDRGFRGFATTSLSLREYREGTRAAADYVVGYLRSPGADPAMRAQLMRELDAKADRAVAQVLESPHAHRSPRPPQYPLGWGQAVVPGKYLEAVYARLQLGDLEPERERRMRDALSLSADYVLGANPLGMVVLTGLGSRRPEEPLHLDSLVWIHRGRPPVPGIPVFGPTNELPGAHYYATGREAFFPPFGDHPPALRYGDIRTFVMTNEFSVWETQAPQALLLSTQVAAGVGPAEGWLPGRQVPARTMAARESSP